MNPFVPFLTLLISWSVDFTDPDVQQLVMYFFIIVHVIISAVMVYIFCRIWAANDPRTLRVKDPYTNEMETITTSGYDFSKWRDLLFTKLSLPVAVGLFIASRWSTPFPLLLQCINNPNALYNNPLFQLHVLNRNEDDNDIVNNNNNNNNNNNMNNNNVDGSLHRPWKEDSVMPEWAQKLWQTGKTDEEAFLNGSQTGGAAGKGKKKRSTSS